MKIVSCTSQLPRVRPRQEPTTATSGAMMEGGMQLLNRDGHSISHNSKRHYHDSFVSMNRMRQRGLLCDIVLHVSNKEIKAHKVVLASCSPYFHAMFTSKFSPWLYSCTCLLFFCRVWWHTNSCMQWTSPHPSTIIASFPSSCLGHRWSNEVCECQISSQYKLFVSLQCVSKQTGVWLCDSAAWLPISDPLIKPFFQQICSSSMIIQIMKS